MKKEEEEEEGDTAMFVMLKEKSQKKDGKKEKKDSCLIKEQGESVPLFEDDYDTQMISASTAYTHI